MEFLSRNQPLLLTRFSFHKIAQSGMLSSHWLGTAGDIEMSVK